MSVDVSAYPVIKSGTIVPPIRPAKAYRHFRNLIADKEDTAEVFHIIEALAGKAFVRNAKEFKNSPNAKELMQRNVNLQQLLDNHDKLRELPADSLGQTYVRFMEKEGLTAAGLIAEFDTYAKDYEKRNDVTEWFGNRMRDFHDLYHVLTGYGRDALGEQCLLGFTYSQNPNLGILFIAYGGGFEMKKEFSSDIPVFSAIRQGQKLGKAAKQIAHHDIEKLLAMPLDEARAFLNIGTPTLYNQAHEMFRNEGIDPYDLLGQKTAVAA